MDSALRETKIKMICIGKVYENALEIKNDVEIEYGRKDDRKKTRCKQVTGKVAIDTGAGIVTFFPSFNEIGWDGKIDGRWEMALAMVGWKGKIRKKDVEPYLDSEIDRVCLTGYLRRYDKYNDKTHEVECRMGYDVRSGNTRIDENDQDGLTLEGPFFVQRFDEDEDTGTGKMRLYYVNFRGEVYPLDIVVDAEDMDIVANGSDIFEAIETEQTRVMKIAYYSTRIGEAPKSVKGCAFGKSRRDTPNVRQGGRFKDEYVLKWAKAQPEPEVDDEDNEDGNGSYWMNPSTVKKALRERAKKLEEMRNSPSKVNPRASVKASVSAAKKQYSKPVVDDFDDEDSGDNKSSFDEFENIF